MLMLKVEGDARKPALLSPPGMGEAGAQVRGHPSASLRTGGELGLGFVLIDEDERKEMSLVL